MKHKWPGIGPYTSLEYDLTQILEAHGIEVQALDVQPRHTDSGATALWTIEGRHLDAKEQREIIRDAQSQKFAVITFPVDTHQEFEELREEQKLEDETWYYVQNQRDVVTELDTPIQNLEKLASTEEKQSAKEAVAIVKETLRELQEIRKRNHLHRVKEETSKPVIDLSEYG